MGGVEAQLSQSVVTTADTVGSYYWDTIERVLSVVVKSDTPITIRTQDAVKTTLKLQTSVEDFFATQSSFIDLLAGVLNIPASRIRIAEVVPPASRRAILASELSVAVFILPVDPTPPPPPPTPPSPPPLAPPPPVGSEITETPETPSVIDSGDAEDTTQTVTPTSVLLDLASLGQLITSIVEDGTLQTQISADPTVSAVITVPPQTVTPEISVAPTPECMPTCKNATVALENGVYGSCSSAGTCECLNTADGTASSVFSYVSADLEALGTDNTTSVAQGCFW